MHPTLDVPDALRDRLPELTARLKHDLGRYVALQCRWLDDHADADALRAALIDDLTATRRGPDGTQTAVQVWAPFAAALTGGAPLLGVSVDLAHDPDVRRLMAAMARIGDLLPALSDATDVGTLEGGREAALAVADACRALHIRAREAVRNG